MFTVDDVCRAMNVKRHAFTNLKRRGAFSFANDTHQGRAEELTDDQALEAAVMLQLCALGLSIKGARATIAAQSVGGGLPAVLFVRRGVLDVQVPVRQIMERLLTGAAPFHPMAQAA